MTALFPAVARLAALLADPVAAALIDTPGMVPVAVAREALAQAGPVQPSHFAARGGPGRRDGHGGRRSIPQADSHPWKPPRRL